MKTQFANKSSLSKEDFNKLVYHCTNKEKAQEVVNQLSQTDMQSCPPSSILALYIIQDLYSEGSTDEANKNRISTNLEAIAEDLYTTSRFIKSIN